MQAAPHCTLALVVGLCALLMAVFVKLLKEIKTKDTSEYSPWQPVALMLLLFFLFTENLQYFGLNWTAAPVFPCISFDTCPP